MVLARFIARTLCPNFGPRTSSFQPRSCEGMERGRHCFWAGPCQNTPRLRHAKQPKVIFVVELVIRLGAERRGFFEGEEKWWSLGSYRRILA